jgi:ferric-dicitrate binding protein FerR (iron transport regulator)
MMSRKESNTPGRFDHEAFVHLLIKQQAGITSRKENAFIKSMLEENAEARELLAEVDETSLNENWVKPHRKRFPLYIAAGVVLLLATGAGYFYFQRPAPGNVQLKTVVAQRATTNTIKLDDGTEVKLNAATTISYPANFSNSSIREVYVEGEAFFTVSPDPKRPFIVHCKLANVEVLGTSFNVCTYDSSFRTALVSGAIAITTHEGEKVKLSPGYTATLETHIPQLLVTAYKPDTVLGWLSGIYRFENTPLEEVCRMAERAYNINISIDSKKLAGVCYSGIINSRKPIELLLEDISYTTEIHHYSDKTGQLHLTAVAPK